jgi:hypothetical protein
MVMAENKRQTEENLPEFDGFLPSNAYFPFKPAHDARRSDEGWLVVLLGMKGLWGQVR